MRDTVSERAIDAPTRALTSRDADMTVFEGQHPQLLCCPKDEDWDGWISLSKTRMYIGGLFVAIHVTLILATNDDDGLTDERNWLIILLSFSLISVVDFDQEVGGKKLPQSILFPHRTSLMTIAALPCTFVACVILKKASTPLNDRLYDPNGYCAQYNNATAYPDEFADVQSSPGLFYVCYLAVNTIFVVMFVLAAQGSPAFEDGVVYAFNVMTDSPVYSSISSWYNSEDCKFWVDKELVVTEDTAATQRGAGGQAGSEDLCSIDAEVGKETLAAGQVVLLVKQDFGKKLKDENPSVQVTQASSDHRVFEVPVALLRPKMKWMYLPAPEPVWKQSKRLLRHLSGP